MRLSVPCFLFSDLLFCLVGIPAALLTIPGLNAELVYLYNVCCVPLHNLFLFSSTWIAALVAAERFFVVVSPLKARMCLKVNEKILFQSEMSDVHESSRPTGRVGSGSGRVGSGPGRVGSRFL